MIDAHLHMYQLHAYMRFEYLSLSYLFCFPKSFNWFRLLRLLQLQLWFVQPNLRLRLRLRLGSGFCNVKQRRRSVRLVQVPVAIAMKPGG